MKYLYRWFLRLSKRRGGGFGPAPIDFTEFDSFFRRIRVEPEPWEQELLEDLDDLWLKLTAEDEKKRQPKKDKDKDE